MGRMCFGQGGTIIPEGFIQGTFPEAYLDWSSDYPGSEKPPPPPPPAGDGPESDDMPGPETNMDAWALGVLASAYKLSTGLPFDPVAVQLLLALSRSQTFYGWPLFPTGIVGEKNETHWMGHHNWCALRCRATVGGKDAPCFQNNGCIAGFAGTEWLRTPSGWRSGPVCYDHQSTNLAGALAYVRASTASPESLRAIQSGNCFQAALELLREGVLVRSLDPGPIELGEDAATFAHRMVEAAIGIAHSTGSGVVVTEGVPQGVHVDLTGPQPPAAPPLPERRWTQPAVIAAGSAVGALIGLGSLWLRNWLKTRSSSAS